MATLRICDAASALGKHPFEVLLAAVRYDKTMSSCWPEMDKDLFDTLALEFGGKPAGTLPGARTEGGEARKALRELGVDDEMAKIVCGLAQENHWGANYAPFKEIQRHFCRNCSPSAVKKAIRSLKRLGIIGAKDQHDGALSLRTDSKALIEKVRKAWESLRAAKG